MPSSLFRNDTDKTLDEKVDDLKRMVGGDPDAAMRLMMRFNPKFAEFVCKYHNSTPEQIAADYGVDIGPIRKYL